MACRLASAVASVELNTQKGINPEVPFRSPPRFPAFAGTSFDFAIVEVSGKVPRSYENPALSEVWARKRVHDVRRQAGLCM